MNHESLSAFARGSSMLHQVEKACLHWQKRHDAAAQSDVSPRVPPAFTVALAREAGTWGTSVAHEVGRLLGWQVYDHTLLEHIAKEMGLRTTLLQSVDERHQNWLAETVAAFASSPAEDERSMFVSASSYVHHLVQTVFALGMHGECVIVGRGASFILPARTTLRVRLIGAVPERITALSRELGVAEKEAAQRLRAMDRDRTDFIRDNFQNDPNDSHNYDLVLNASRFSIAQNAELIVEMLHRLQARAAAETESQEAVGAGAP